MRCFKICTPCQILLRWSNQCLIIFPYNSCHHIIHTHWLYWCEIKLLPINSKHTFFCVKCERNKKCHHHKQTVVIAQIQSMRADIVWNKLFLSTAHISWPCSYVNVTCNTDTYNTVETPYCNRGQCYQSAIVIKISGPKTLHLKSIKNKPFIVINRLLLSNYKLFQYIFSHFGP